MSTFIEYLLQQGMALLAPVGMVWGALILLTVLLWWRQQRGLAALVAALVVFITIIGGTALPGSLLASLERPYAGVAPDSLPTADAAVLLGGGADIARYEVGGVHLTPAGDRLAMAAEVMRLGKAPVLLLGGGVRTLDGRTRFEADAVAQLLARWGVPEKAMISLGGCTDTHDEAIDTLTLAQQRGWRHVLVITSANHLPRAVPTFRHMGLEVTAVPCNFLTSVGAGEVPWVPRVPGTDGFVKMGIWLHEKIGWLMYWRRGWLMPVPPK
ncbi:MAG: YdcF family protein [Chthoniobacter sp.]|nr:YdcF family protein [Chthoniobacter sp.]